MSAFLASLSSPPLLFFFLGAAAVAVRSDLQIPAQIAKFLSLYLLFAIGFKGGVALSESTIDGAILLTLLAMVLLSAVVPLYTFFLLRRRLPVADAAAIAATYGSVSAVTFVTATGYLDIQGVEWSGYMVAAMALMESPAIIVGILLYSHFGRREGSAGISLSWPHLFRESITNGSVFLILGSMLIGWVTGTEGMQKVQPLVKDLFLGLLCLFLLDMGIVAAQRLRDFQQSGDRRPSGQAFRVMLVAALLLPVLNAAVGLAIARLLGLSEGNALLFVVLAASASYIAVPAAMRLALPVLNAALGLVIARLLGLPEGNALLFVVLAASASYIAVPAAMRLALPEANPAIYLTMSLAITFPLNLLIGIPAYHAAIRWWL